MEFYAGGYKILHWADSIEDALLFDYVGELMYALLKAPKVVGCPFCPPGAGVNSWRLARIVTIEEVPAGTTRKVIKVL
jgi:hypothetical protein